MKKKSQADYEIAEDKANIKISRKIKTLHPVVVNIANNLAALTHQKIFGSSHAIGQYNFYKNPVSEPNFLQK